MKLLNNIQDDYISFGLESYLYLFDKINKCPECNSHFVIDRDEALQKWTDFHCSKSYRHFLVKGDASKEGLKLIRDLTKEISIHLVPEINKFVLRSGAKFLFDLNATTNIVDKFLYQPIQEIKKDLDKYLILI
jgi:hypothetical protein